jgi:hypothetical protein
MLSLDHSNAFCVKKHLKLKKRWFCTKRHTTSDPFTGVKYVKKLFYKNLGFQMHVQGVKIPNVLYISVFIAIRSFQVDQILKIMLKYSILEVSNTNVVLVWLNLKIIGPYKGTLTIIKFRKHTFVLIVKLHLFNRMS